jgi:hypothetical protein
MNIIIFTIILRFFIPIGLDNQARPISMTCLLTFKTFIGLIDNLVYSVVVFMLISNFLKMSGTYGLLTVIVILAGLISGFQKFNAVNHGWNHQPLFKGNNESQRTDFNIDYYSKLTA